MFNFAAQSGLARLLRDHSPVILVDEAALHHRVLLESLNITLQFVRDDARPFGGLSIVLGGDFRQVLPVIPGAERPRQVDASLLRSPLWSHFHAVIRLHDNMRVHLLRDKNPARAAALHNWSVRLLNLGDGVLQRAQRTLPHDVRLRLQQAQHVQQQVASEG